MPEEPSRVLDRILKNVEDLVNAEKEEKVRRLQIDINDAIKKAGENLRLKLSLASPPGERKSAR